METGAREESTVEDQSQKEKSICKHSTSESQAEPVSESIQGYDVPDGPRTEALSSFSGALPDPAGVPIQTDSKKKQKLFKRNKKKSHEGNQHSNLNKALLSVNVDSGKSLFSLFILDLHSIFFLLKIH